MGAEKINEYLHLAREVERRYAVPMTRQLAEIVRLSRGPGRIGPGDYYIYSLYDPGLPNDEKFRFVGWKVESRLDALNDPRWHCLGLDKVMMYALFQSNGIRIPETKAIYLPGRSRLLGGAMSLTSETELHAWLRNQDHYPFFSKPSASGFARGAYSAIRYEPAEDSVVIRDGKRFPVESFTCYFEDVERLGYLFQAPLKQDRRLVPWLGETPSSLRVMVLMDEHEGPLIHRTFWKLPTGNNYSDNFDSGRSGNLAAAIEETTGRVTRVISGVGLELREIEKHPDTGMPLKELEIPDWREVREFVLTAALALPKLRFQQWDIGLTDDGPVAIEVNLFGTGGSDLTQILYRKGLLDETMARFLARRGQ